MEFCRVKYHGFLVYCDWLIVFLCRNPTMKMKWNLYRLFLTIDKNWHFFTNWFQLCAIWQNWLNFLRRDVRRLFVLLPLSFHVIITQNNFIFLTPLLETFSMALHKKTAAYTSAFTARKRGPIFPFEANHAAKYLLYFIWIYK